MTQKITNRIISSTALPMVVSNYSIPILGATDTGVIGQLGDPSLLSSVGISAISISTNHQSHPGHTPLTIKG